MSDETLSKSEVRYKQLYEYAKNNRDNSIISALGIITTDYISDKNALPLSVYRIRSIIADVKSRDNKIEEIQNQLNLCFKSNFTFPSRVKYATASKGIFRRVK